MALAAGKFSHSLRQSLLTSLTAAALGLAAASAWAVEPPEGFIGAYLAGRVAEQRGETSIAAGLLSRALALAPDTPRLRRRVVGLLAVEGEIDPAAKDAEALSAMGENGFPIGMLRISKRFLTGDYAGVREIAADPRANGLSPVIATLADAWAMAGAGDIDGGARKLTDAARDMQGLKVLLMLHAGMLAEQGERVDLARWMYEEAVAAAESEERPFSPRLVQVVAGFHDRNDAAEASAAIRAKAGEGIENPDDTAAVGQIVKSAAEGFGEALFNFAGGLYQERQYRSALVYGRLADSLRTADPATRQTIGQILEASGRSEAAAAAYRAVPKAGSYAWRAPLRAADAMANAGDIDGAAIAMRDVMAIAPKEFEPAISLGHLLRSANQFEEAAEAYDEAIKRKGGLGPSDGWLRYARAIALERSGRWEEAEKEFLAALETLGNEPLILNYLGYSWIDRGENLDRARDMVARAVELRPENGFITDSLGWAEYRAGDFEAAVSTLERAIALQPVDPVINEHLGDAYWQVGRYREARFQWRRALAFEPDAELIPVIQNKLRCGVDGCPAASAPKTDEAKQSNRDGG
jgi:tetratricopeptide (TPR) repeat protein